MSDPKDDNPTKEQEHTKVNCWCGHGQSSHVDRHSGLVSGANIYRLGCLDCEAVGKR